MNSRHGDAHSRELVTPPPRYPTGVASGQPPGADACPHDVHPSSEVWITRPPKHGDQRPGKAVIHVQTPSYWKFHGRPVRVVETEDGGLTVQQFDPQRQLWERRIGILASILGGDPDADELTAKDFERWIAAIRAGATEEAAYQEAMAQSSSLVEGVVKAVEGDELYVRGQWWKARGGLTSTVRTGDWVQLRPIGERSERAEGALITELRPARR